MPNGRTEVTDRGNELSTALGPMSLDDPSTHAENSSDDAPFRENITLFPSDDLRIRPTTTNHPQREHHTITLFSPRNLGIAGPDPNTIRKPNSKEEEMRTVREMWAASPRNPTTQPTPDGIQMVKSGLLLYPSFQPQQQQPHGPQEQQFRRRSSSYSGNVGWFERATTQSTKPYLLAASLIQQISASGSNLPHAPITQSTRQGGTYTVSRLRDQSSKINETGILPSLAPVRTEFAASMSTESLPSYRDAILTHKAPGFGKIKMGPPSEYIKPLPRSSSRMSIGSSIGDYESEGMASQSEDNEKEKMRMAPVYSLNHFRDALENTGSPCNSPNRAAKQPARPLAKRKRQQSRDERPGIRRKSSAYDE
ncbi:hypothetical protein M408DRAFT_25470, partial [Serendipita vermifera MAFF 305830]